MRLPLLLALAALLGSPTLAGCIGTAAASATEAKSSADDAARAWDADAQLVNIVGIEGTFPLLAAAALGGPTGEDWSAAKDDKTVGDGLAEVWAFRYVAPSKSRAYVVVVDRDEEIVRAEESFRRDDEPLGSWSVDSDDALDIARDANDALANGVARDEFGVFALLHHENGRAEWVIAGGGGDDLGVGGGFVRIDARTGDVLESAGGYHEA